MKYITTLITTLTLTAVCTSVYIPTVEASTSTYRQAKTSLHLRKGASIDQPSLAVIPTGIYVTELSKVGTWSKVQYGTKIGYASTKYLLTDEQIGGKRIGKTLIANKNLALRSTYAPGENQQARAAFEKMRIAAKKEGITLVAFSTYRSYAYQKRYLINMLRVMDMRRRVRIVRNLEKVNTRLVLRLISEALIQQNTPRSAFQKQKRQNGCLRMLTAMASISAIHRAKNLGRVIRMRAGTIGMSEQRLPLA